METLANGDGGGENAIVDSNGIMRSTAGEGEIDGRAMRDGDSFRFAGGAGRIDDVGEAVGIGESWEVGISYE